MTLRGYRIPARTLAVTTSIAPACATPVAATPPVTFQGRVAAQEATERVYYTHRIGATQPFESIYPRELLEAKVREYLAKSQALSLTWNTDITPEMLKREGERIVRTIIDDTIRGTRLAGFPGP